MSYFIDNGARKFRWAWKLASKTKSRTNLTNLDDSGERCECLLPALLVLCLLKVPFLLLLTGLISLSPLRSGLRCALESLRLRDAESGLSESLRAFRPPSSLSGASAEGCEPRRPHTPGGRQLSSYAVFCRWRRECLRSGLAWGRESLLPAKIFIFKHY